MGGRDDAGGERSGCARGLERAEHVRRRAARADADHGVGGTDLERKNVAGAALAVVLGLRLGERRAPRPAGDQRDDDSRRNGEGRLALGRVERGDHPGRSRADVHEAPAAAKSLRDGVDRRCDGRRHRPDGCGNGRVGLVHELDELQRLARLVACRGVAAGFRHESVVGHRASLR